MLSAEPQAVIPTEYALLQNFPNPFNPETWIPFHLPETAEVTVRIYNATGEPIRTLSLGLKVPGEYATPNHAAYWDGRTDSGERVASGVYFYSIQAGRFSATRKMVVGK